VNQEELNEVRRLLDWIYVGVESVAFIGVLTLAALVTVLVWK
jgi:hypothetical protein